MNGRLQLEICCLSFSRRIRKDMKSTRRSRRCQETTQSYASNNQLQNKKGRKPLSQNIQQSASSSQNRKRKSSQKENLTSLLSNSPRASSSQNPKRKSSQKEKLTSLLSNSPRDASTPHKLSKIDIANSSTCKRRSTRLNGQSPKCFELDILQSTSRRNFGKSAVAKSKVINGISCLESPKVTRSAKKSAVAKGKVLNGISCLESPKVTRSTRNSSNIPFLTSTPIMPCSIKIQRSDCINVTTVKRNPKKRNAKRKGPAQSDSTLNLESPSKNESASESMSLRPRRISVKQNVESSDVQSKKRSSSSKKHTPEHNVENGSAKKRRKFVKKIDSKLKQKIKCKSFAALPSIDVLSLTNRKRKAKSENFKLPGKNTLKRKKLIMKELDKTNEGYEDDLYEAQKFDHFKDLLEDTGSLSDVSSSTSIATPQIGIHVTPMIRYSRSPIFKDVVSPAELALNRKLALEVQYRNKRWKSKSASAEAEKSSAMPEKKKLEFKQALANMESQEKSIQKLLDDETSEDDSYFSDFE